MKILSKSLKETAKIGEDFLEKISRLKRETATIVGLFGDLGSGKTTFVQSLAKILKVAETVTSPTFVIEKIYSLNSKKGFDKLIHIDAYRLDSGKELLNLEFAEICRDPKNLILIEWPERVDDVLPKEVLRINFRFISENEREIDVL